MGTDEGKVKNSRNILSERLNDACHIVAPMVDQSELAWRLLCRRHGAHLCYTPMLHASVFVKDARYRKNNLISCSEDRPLIVQFCANDPKTFVEAAKYCEGLCEAVDLNIGCPQTIAKKGHYGAFLSDEWDLLFEMVSKASKEVDLPITCKIRVFPELERTIAYAKMLESAGCSLLTVHGRTKEQKGPMTGIADWKAIEAIKKTIKIPVFANGNIQYLSDVERCLKETGVDGIMSAEGNLHNPYIFEGKNAVSWEVALEYLQIVSSYPCPMSFIRGHLFKMFIHCMSLKCAIDIREQLAKANSIDSFIQAVEQIQSRFTNLSEDEWKMECIHLRFPPWICQPYVRPSPKKKESQHDSKKRPIEQDESVNEQGLSRNKLKKLRRYPNKKFNENKVLLEICTKCSNPKGIKCTNLMCKSCCRIACKTTLSSCPGHKLGKRKEKKQPTNENLVAIDS